MRSGAGYKLARQAAFVELTTDEGHHGLRAVLVRQRLARPRLGRLALRQHVRAGARRRGPAPHRAPLGQDLLRLDHARARPAQRSASRSSRRSTSRSGTSRARRSARPIYELLGGAVPGPACRATRARSTGRRPSDAVRAGAGVPRHGLQGVQGQGRPRRRERHRVAARDPRRRSATTSTCSSTRTSATRATSRCRSAASSRSSNVLFFEEPLPIDDVDGHAFLADKLDVRIATGENMYTRWDFLPFFQARRDPRGAGRRLALRRHQRGEADLRPRGRLSTCTPSRTRSRTRSRSRPTCTSSRPSSNAPIIEYDAHVQPDPDGARHEPAAVHDSVIELPTEPGPRRRDRLGLRRRPPVHGRDRHRRRLAARRSGWPPRSSPTGSCRRCKSPEPHARGPATRGGAHMKIGLLTVLFNDKPLEEVADYAAGLGYEAFELAAWRGSNHFDTDRAKEIPPTRATSRRCSRTTGSMISALSNHLFSQMVLPFTTRRWTSGRAPRTRTRSSSSARSTSSRRPRSRPSSRCRWSAASSARRCGRAGTSGRRSAWRSTTRAGSSSSSAGRRSSTASRSSASRFAHEVHPTEIAYNVYTAREAIKRLGGRDDWGFNFDPSHLIWQMIDPVVFIKKFGDRILHVARQGLGAAEGHPAHRRRHRHRLVAAPGPRRPLPRAGLGRRRVAPRHHRPARGGLRLRA